jgi:hypothetical protein
MAFFKTSDARVTAPAREHFGEKYSYQQLRMALAHLEFLEKE